VYVEDTSYNYELVEDGYATVYDNSQFVKQNSFYDGEDTAQETNAGLWGECTSISDSDGSGTATDTTSSDGFSISQIHDPVGND
jgi:endonuclease YncB( thermonuclease family)